MMLIRRRNFGCGTGKLGCRQLFENEEETKSGIEPREKF